MLSRRRVLAVGGLVALAGCASSTESDDSALEVAYAVEATNVDDIPADVSQHENQDGFSWYVVSAEVSGGEVPIADFIGLTQLEAGGTKEPARGAAVGDTVVSGESDSEAESKVGGGDTVEVYYRVSADNGGGDGADVEWVTEQLENQHRELKLSEE